MFPLCNLSIHLLCSHTELMLANFVVLSNAAILLSRKKILRLVILKPHIHTAASRFLTSRCFLKRSKSLLPFRLVMLQKCFQTSPAVIGVVSGLVFWTTCCYEPFQPSWSLTIFSCIKSSNRWVYQSQTSFVFVTPGSNVTMMSSQNGTRMCRKNTFIPAREKWLG